MKKVLFVCDGIAFSESAFDFACRMNDMQPILLIAVCMPQISYANLWSYTNALGGPAVLPLIETRDADMIQENIRKFVDRCQVKRIAYRVHKDYADFAIPELSKESRFADLLLLSSERFYNNILGDENIEYLIETLREAECPILIVSEETGFPVKNVIAYDGSASAVYALKQFAYLFPDLCMQETTVLYLHENDGKGLPHEAKLKELVQLHYPNADFFRADTISKKQFSSWIAEEGNVCLIAGSFGRSSISELFKKSFLHDVITDHKVPVFIAHQ